MAGRSCPAESVSNRRVRSDHVVDRKIRRADPELDGPRAGRVSTRPVLFEDDAAIEGVPVREPHW